MIDFIKKYKFVLLTAAVLVVAIVLVFFFSGGEVSVADSGASSQSVQSTADLTTNSSEAPPLSSTSAQSSIPATQATSLTSDTNATSAVSSILSNTASGTPKPADTTVPDSTAMQSETKPESIKPSSVTTKATTPAQTAKPQIVTTAVTTVKTAKPPQSSVSRTTPATTEQSAPSPVNYDSSCVFRIDCSTILDNMDKLDKNLASFVPSNGVIYESTEVGFNGGESAFDILKRVCRENNIQMEASFTPAFNSSYVEGINNLYEFDCGSASGWVYRVNGEVPNKGCSLYKVNDGDVVEFLYTCDLGLDIQ